MIGWINLSVQDFILKAFGEDAWNKIVAESGVEVAWVSSCPYPDKITYDLVITAASILGVTVEQALEAYGVFFIQYVGEQGYTKLLKTLGSTIVEFLANLNNLHLHLMGGTPAMDPPAFRVDHVTATSCHLHYYSTRPALGPIVVGVLKGYSSEYLEFELKVTLIESRDKGGDHEVFLIEYPEQANVHVPAARTSDAGNEAASQAAGAAAGSASLLSGLTGPSGGFTLAPDSFAELFPFHLVLDSKLNIMQHGAVLSKLVPNIAAGKNIGELFALRHPHTELSWEGITRETASSFVLQVPSTGLQLKGQMIPSSIPVPGCPVPKPVMLFLGSPRLANLDEMLKVGLFLSDIPLHDLSRDFVLLAEQRQAEADLKEKFEKLTLDLKAEKARSDALVQRMSGLLACFPFKGKGAGKDKKEHEPAIPEGGAKIESAIHEADEAFGRMEVIDAVRRTLNHMNIKQSNDDQVEIVQAIGEGTYGKVYRGLWQGTEVAIKTIILPAGMSGAQKREKMAIMEAAISSSLSHPNIVQTYTYNIKPLRDSAVLKGLEGEEGRTSAGSGGNKGSGASGTYATYATQGTLGPASGKSGGKGAIHSYEVRLILELCDQGSLRDALDGGCFLLVDPEHPEGPPALNYAAVLDTAMDIAKACIHLHRNNVLHTDLKARNVLLRGVGGTGRGISAKIGDFGLAVKLSDDASHMSGLFQGTLTHMAPEVLLDGRASKASDVYAFGITLWELFTGDHAFKGVPKTLLGHQVTVEHRRPDFPPSTPAKFKQLATWCWNKDTHVRPTFEEVLSTLVAMRRELGGATPPLRPLAPIGAPAPSTGTAAMDHTTAGAVGASVSVPAPPAALAAAKAYQEAQEQLLLQQQQAAASSVGNAEHSTTNTMVSGPLHARSAALVRVAQPVEEAGSMSYMPESDSDYDDESD